MDTEEPDRLGLKNILKSIPSLIVAAGAVFGLYHGFNLYLDVRISAKINDTEYLRALAQNVRPSVVFDDNNSIIADMGAAHLLNEITVSRDKDHFKIMISPLRHLAVEPILEPLDGEYSIHAERGQKFNWVFTLHHVQAILWDNSPERERQRFRLELVP